MACTCVPMLTDEWVFIGAGGRHLCVSSVFRGKHMGTELHLYKTMILRCLGREVMLRVAVAPPDKSIT